MTKMMTMANRTPITIPAIAPPSMPELDAPDPTIEANCTG